MYKFAIATLFALIALVGTADARPYGYGPQPQYRQPSHQYYPKPQPRIYYYPQPYYVAPPVYVNPYYRYYYPSPGVQIWVR